MFSQYIEILPSRSCVYNDYRKRDIERSGSTINTNTKLHNSFYWVR